MFEIADTPTEVAGADVSIAVAPAASQADDVDARVRAYVAALGPLTPRERLAFVRNAISGRIVFTHGFGIEGQVILHWICEQGLDIDLVTLDTGRLFPETYELWGDTERRYGRRIRAIYPDQQALENLVARDGIDGLYLSRDARLACCDTRKVRPLDRALAGAGAWITGARADQTAVRREGGLIGFEKSRSLIKFNPLFDWSRKQVLAFAREHRVPINPLHARGFASIGCAPCTRALGSGEPERNGRWWWEQGDNRECGLHLPRQPGAAP